MERTTNEWMCARAHILATNPYVKGLRTRLARVEREIEDAERKVDQSVGCMDTLEAFLSGNLDGDTANIMEGFMRGHPRLRELAVLLLCKQTLERAIAKRVAALIPARLDGPPN
ncbi:hypothetical protein EBS80_03910 [bacterium]|nr:hypothetical protein [bacterium]